MATKRFRLQDYNWESGLFIIGYHVALAIGLPIYFWHNTPGWGLIAASLFLLFISQIGIGGAYHRFYAHRGYTLKRPAEFGLLFLGTLACQGPVLRWSSEHRRHHAYVDTDDDPHSINKGFWYAHILWLFEKSEPIDERRCADLLKNRWVMLQFNHYGLWMLAANLLAFAAVGLLTGDWLGSFVLAWWTRLAVSHHLTWFINSLAHTWGSRAYSKEQTAVDNHIVALLTVGEGYHNYHHTFASDYRNGVRWFHFDPTKWTIWTLSKLGLAGNLVRYSPFTIRQRLLSEDRKLLQSTLRERALEGTAALERRVEELAETIREKLNRLNSLASEIKMMKRMPDRNSLNHARAEFVRLKKSLQDDWQDWYQLCTAVLDTA